MPQKLATLTYCLFIYSFIKHFGWKGGFLITGAITLLNILFGALFKPLPMSTAESCSTEDTPNLPDLDENNEVLKKSSKNHSFCSDNGVPPVS